MHTYVFILCPPYCGSTVLWKLIGTADAVSSLPAEGQSLPELKEMMRRDPWNADAPLDWPRIKAVWHTYWDTEKPVLLEKSPPNLIRTDAIMQQFDPVYFIAMVRNPYAHCEGLMRRNKWDAATAADAAVRMLRRQTENADTLPNVLSFTYERLVGEPDVVAEMIESFVPDIGTLEHNARFKADSIDGKVRRGIVDLNAKKIRNLSPRDLRTITDVLREHPDVMARWGYDSLEPDRAHAAAYARRRAFTAIGGPTFTRLARKVIGRLR